jgi:hypothetical protein
MRWWWFRCTKGLVTNKRSIYFYTPSPPRTRLVVVVVVVVVAVVLIYLYIRDDHRFVL